MRQGGDRRAARAEAGRRWEEAGRRWEAGETGRGPTCTVRTRRPNSYHSYRVADIIANADVLPAHGPPTKATERSDPGPSVHMVPMNRASEKCSLQKDYTRARLSTSW